MHVLRRWLGGDDPGERAMAPAPADDPSDPYLLHKVATVRPAPTLLRQRPALRTDEADTLGPISRNRLARDAAAATLGVGAVILLVSSLLPSSEGDVLSATQPPGFPAAVSLDPAGSGGLDGPAGLGSIDAVLPSLAPGTAPPPTDPGPSLPVSVTLAPSDPLATLGPTVGPTFGSTSAPTFGPTFAPTFRPTPLPTNPPTAPPTVAPTARPTGTPPSTPAPTPVPTPTPNPPPTPPPTPPPPPEPPPPTPTPDVTEESPPPASDEPLVPLPSDLLPLP